MASNSRKAQQANCPHTNTFSGIASKWCLDCGLAGPTEHFERKWAERKIVEAK